jgi:hypothetical protein
MIGPPSSEARRWERSKPQLEIITDAATARIPIAALARQLCVDESELVAWARRVAARELAAAESGDDWDFAVSENFSTL